MIKKKECIKTKRLIIKPFSLEDENDLVDILTNKEISKTFMIPDYKTIEEYRVLANKLISFSRLDDIKHYEYGIYLNNKLIGFVNDCGYDENEIEVGYVIHPNYKGNGYATETLKAVIKDLFEMGFKKVTCGYFIENVASKKVMLKAGMKETSIITTEEYRGVIHSCGNCEVVKNEN